MKPLAAPVDPVTHKNIYAFAHARGVTPAEFVAALVREWADGPGRAWAEAEPLDIDERGRDELRYRAIEYLRMTPEDRAAHDDAGVQMMDWLAERLARDGK